MKAILMIDIPDNYQEYGNGEWYVIGDDLKVVFEENGVLMGYKYFGENIAKLKPIANFEEVIKTSEIIDRFGRTDSEDFYSFENGFKACLEEIEKWKQY